MTTSLSVTVSVSEEKYLVSANITSTDIPVNIFLYENNGTGLGDYIGVCSLQEYLKVQDYVPGTPTPLFGNKLLKTTYVSKSIPLTSDPQAVADNIAAGCKGFKAEYAAFITPVTKVYSI